MILVATIALTLQAAPTLAAVDQSSPEAAGELLLAGKDHRPIVAMVVPRLNGLPPGFAERQLVEQPVAEKGGCVRKRWTVTFARKPGETESKPESDIWAGDEVALPSPAGCPDERYVHLNPGLEAAQALLALRYLDHLRLGDAPARFACSDETASGLCADPGTIRRALANLTPWAATRQDGEMIFWLGAPGQAVTEVRYRLAQPDDVTVSRRVPAPF